MVGTVLVHKPHEVLLHKSKRAMFDAWNPVNYRDTMLDKIVNNWFVQQNPRRRLCRCRTPGHRPDQPSD
jgi:hypothetical protein